MNALERFHRYAAESVERAKTAKDPGDRDIHLNMALAWVRLAHQSEAVSPAEADDEPAEPADRPASS